MAGRSDGKRVIAATGTGDRAAAAVETSEPGRQGVAPFSVLFSREGASFWRHDATQQLPDRLSQNMTIGGATAEMVPNAGCADKDGMRAGELELQEAADLVAQSICEFGQEHSNTLRAMTKLSFLCGRLGKVDEAEELCRQVYEIRERTLGPDNMDTVAAMCNLAGACTDADESAAFVARVRAATKLLMPNAPNDCGIQSTETPFHPMSL
eukprot:m.189724 g.189724  ORF g.189724 m.189724 type:complete len:210 (-) comp15115_c0_seq6:113-742(-)